MFNVFCVKRKFHFSLSLCKALSCLSKISNVDVCASCVNIPYAEFLELMLTREDPTTIDNNAIMQKLSTQFALQEITGVVKSKSVCNDRENKRNPNPSTDTLTVSPSIGIENKQSNCWLNSVLQCALITEIHKSYAGKSIVLDELHYCFQEMAKTPETKNTATYVHFVNGPLLLWQPMLE